MKLSSTVASEEGMKEVEEGEEEVRSLERREGLLKAELNEVEEVDWLEQRNIYKERRKSAEEQLRRAERGVECAKEELEDMKKEFEGLQKVLVELQSKGACLEKQCYVGAVRRVVCGRWMGGDLRCYIG